jgi:glycosyltransferase involved in cell wall biosynthesis
MTAVAQAGWSVEILIVDDGSTDGTLEVARTWSRDCPEVQYLSLSRNFGKEAAMFAGLKAAAGDLVLIMDADGQHPAEVIPLLIDDQASTGADQVVARRDRTGDPRLRSAVSHLFYRASNRLSEVDLVSGDGDFRLLTRKAVQAVLALNETNRFSKGIFAWIGFRTTVVTYPNQRRIAGSSSWNNSRLVDYAVDGLISFNTRPLRLVIYLGWTAVVLALAYLVWLLIYTAMYGIDSPGYVTVIAAIVLIGGIQLVSIGVVGEYVGRIFLETKRRPMFLVAESSLRDTPGENRSDADFTIDGGHSRR